jgi:hypothetical protein
MRAQPGASSSSTAPGTAQHRCRSRRARHQHQHPGASPSFAEAGGHSEAALSFAASHCQQWAAAVQRLTADMHGCGWCGRVALGGQHSQHRRHMKPRACDGFPAAVLANPALLDLAAVTLADFQQRCAIVEKLQRLLAVRIVCLTHACCAAAFRSHHKTPAALPCTLLQPLQPFSCWPGCCWPGCC